jgi:hypothetical protein
MGMVSEVQTIIHTRRPFPWRMAWRVCWIAVLGLVAVYLLLAIGTFIFVMP